MSFTPWEERSASEKAASYPLNEQAVEAALRRLIAGVDYDTYKYLGSDEETGHDSFPGLAEEFIDHYAGALDDQVAPAPTKEPEPMDLNTMSLSEIERVIIEGNEDAADGSDYREGGWSWLAWEEPGPFQIPDFGKVEVIEQVGGGEGSGSHMHIVVKVTDAAGVEHFFKKLGYYASYVGGEWDGAFVRVTPQEKTVTVYEQVKG